MTDLIGQSLGRYHILEQLGEGGMATVYKAYDTRLERDVAVKVIRIDQFAPAVLERILKRFEREAKALARLTHSNIVHVNDYGEQEGVPYLVMDYLPGGTLKQRLGKPMPWQAAVKLLLPVAEALDYAHSQNIIHRDIKPSNILLTQNDQPMLTDFGIAKILESGETAELTGTGMGVGTPEYMAPEQINARSVDQRADIYALGVVLYEMVTGRKPFQADTPMAVMIMQARDPLPPPRQFVPDLPESMERMLFKALAKNPEDRYQNMSEFAKALDGLASVSPSPKPKETSGATWSRWTTIFILVGLLGIGLVLGGLLTKMGQQAHVPIASLVAATRTTKPLTKIASSTATRTLMPTSTPTLSSTRALLPPKVIATAIALSNEPQMLHEDFEQSGANLGNTSGGEWSTKVVDGNGLLEIQNAIIKSHIVFGSESWVNYLFGFRFKVTECNPNLWFGCILIVTCRNVDGQAYVLLIDTNKGEVSLDFGGRDGWTGFDRGVTDTFLNLSLGSWHDVLFAADQEEISAAVDGTWTTSVSDDRLKTGAVGIEVGEGTTVQFDDFNAWDIPLNAP